MSQARILVIEDDVFIADDVSAYLEQFGYDVVGPVASAEEAIATARRERPDLLLADIRLVGEQDGIDAATQIRAELGIHVVYLTAHADDETLERAQITEPFGYVLKPFSELELRAAIKLALLKAGRIAPETSTTGRSQLDKLPLTDALENSTSVERIVRLLGEVRYFRGLASDALEEIAENARITRHKAGEVLICEDDQKAPGFLVISGRVTMFKVSASGREFTVELLPPGDPFGLGVSLAWQPYPVSVKAQVASEVLWIPYAMIVKLFDRFPELSRNLVTDVFDRLRTAHSIARGLAHDRTDVRVATALLALVPRFAGRDTALSDEMVPMTRQELADCIGCATETVVRVTKSLEREDVLDLSKRGRITVLDGERLREIAAC